MKINCQAQLLTNFLRPLAPIWGEEIMNEYPESLSAYPREWIELLLPLSEQELYQIDSKEIISKIEGNSFQEFMSVLKTLSKLTQKEKGPEIDLESWAFNGIKKKKRHEIQTIIPVIKKLKEENTTIESIVDIGGGVGHLARILAHYHSIPCLSIDRDEKFQKIGLLRSLKYRKLQNAAELKFLNLEFSNSNESTQQATLKTVFNPKTFIVGLHTCGPLANTLIKTAVDYKTVGVLSFGCCYHHLNPKKDFPLSEFYKKNGHLSLNLFALSLATRSHSAMSFSDYQTKERVKYYRYALHLFLMEHFHNKYFTDVGECLIKTYWAPFPNYIREKLSELNLSHQFTDCDFLDFYQSAKTQEKLRIMWVCNIIRWQLGRALEIYLLLDRCHFLEEQGLSVKIEEYFTESLSPRNIGILALRK